MVVTNNQVISATVVKLKKFLRKIHPKENVTEKQYKDIKERFISFQPIDSDLKNHPETPEYCSINESLNNLSLSETVQSAPKDLHQEHPQITKANNTSVEPIYATIDKTTLNSRKSQGPLNLETFQQTVRHEIEKGPSDTMKIQPPLEQKAGTETIVAAQRCRVQILDAVAPKSIELSEKNVEAFKNYVNNNLFNSTPISHVESLTSQTNMKISNAVAEKFVVNMYESRPSKRWRKKEAVALKNRLLSYDNNFECKVNNSNDNHSANIDTALLGDNSVVSLACLENYYSAISTHQVTNDANEDEDVYQTLEDAKQKRDTLNETYLTPTGQKHNSQALAPSIYFSMSDDPYYSEVHEQEQPQDSAGSDQEEFFRLRQAADIQCSIMRQAYKAIEACRRTKQFCNSAEKVMAEKILLLANQKHTTLVQSIRNSQYDNIILTPKCPLPEITTAINNKIGSVVIRNVQIPLRTDWLESGHNSTRYKNWFLVVASEGDRMLSSETYLLQPGEKHLIFEQQFQFDQLDAEFRVELSVYHMRLRNEEAGVELKYTFNKRVSTLCRSFRKIHYKDLQTQTLVANRIPSSGFTKCGSLMVTVHDLSSRTNWRLSTNTNTKSNTLSSTISHSNNYYDRQQSILNKVQEYDIPIEDTFAMDLSVSKTELQLQRSGFLTIGSESGGTTTWNRRWCVLNGTNLHLYNDPVEEDVNKSCGITLSLRSVMITTIDIAPRAKCPKPRCLMLDTARVGAQKCYVRMRHFLKPDTKQEMDAWRRDLNTVIALLRNWNELPYVEKLVTDL